MQCIHNKSALIRRPFRSLWKTNRKFVAKNTKVYILLLFIHSKILNHQRLDYGFCEIEILKPLDILMKENFKNKSFYWFTYIVHESIAFYSDTQSTLALVDWMWSFIQYLLYLLYDYLLLDGSGCMVAKKRRQIILGGSTTKLFIIVFAAENF